MASIDTLPNELLSNIQEEAIKSDLESTPQNSLTLSSISRVSKRWRQASLRNGRLWSNSIDLNSNSLLWVEEAFQRAKDIPLVIFSENDFTPDFKSDTWQHAFCNTHHWGTFSLNAPLYNNSILADHLQRPFPVLDSFQLINTNGLSESTSDEDEATSTWWDDQFILPDNLFGGCAPCLQAFVMENVSLLPSFNFSVWGRLTFLQVTQENNEYIIPNWLEILRPMVLLEHLHLQGVFSHADLESMDNAEDVHLEHLSTLLLGGGIDNPVMFNFFAKTVVPSTCQVEIKAYWYDGVQYSPSAFPKLKLGFNHHVKRLLEANDPQLLALRLYNSLESKDFGFDLCLVSAEPDWQRNFRFHQVDPDFEKPLPESRGSHPQMMQNFTTIPHAQSSNNPFSKMLEVLEDVPVSQLVTEEWPHIVLEDVGPLLRFLSKNGNNLVSFTMFHTNPILLNILKAKMCQDGIVLLPHLSLFHFFPENFDGVRRLADFKRWYVTFTRKESVVVDIDYIVGV
ncbi:hypothetical protein BDN70DRAFT_938013 [Pholiota conissans]|uniref:F-box domain-containing protein n=1 Tax=Pholiota conissans TaxID=109636 RepID=A0A9P5YNP8_9AGAR|nr:hypothetical protein BDN70DRAFT_938013 [Pholiota conissans]